MDNPTAIAEKTRRVSGVGVAKSSELLVVAADEGWTRVDAMGSVDESSIEAKTQFCHGLGFVDVGARKKLRSKVAKDLLCGGEDGEVIFPASSNIEQAKQDPLGTDTERVIEVPGDTLAQEVGRDICSPNLGKGRLNRVDRDCIGGNAGTKERAHAKQPKPKLAQELTEGKLLIRAGSNCRTCRRDTWLSQTPTVRSLSE